MLEESPFLKPVMPWGDMSASKMNTPQESNDGPILWIRPGEQLIPTAELGSRTPKSANKRIQSELKSLQLRRASEPRELMFEDRFVNIIASSFLFHLTINLAFLELDVMQIMLARALIDTQRQQLVSLKLSTVGQNHLKIVSPKMLLHFMRETLMN